MYPLAIIALAPVWQFKVILPDMGYYKLRISFFFLNCVFYQLNILWVNNLENEWSLTTVLLWLIS